MKKASTLFAYASALAMSSEMSRVYQEWEPMEKVGRSKKARRKNKISKLSRRKNRGQK